MTAEQALAAALSITGHVGDAHQVTLGTDLAEHTHDDCLFKEPTAKDASVLLAALAADGWTLVRVEDVAERIYGGTHDGWEGEHAPRRFWRAEARRILGLEETP